jgi:hypothetical protein
MQQKLRLEISAAKVWRILDETKQNDEHGFTTKTMKNTGLEAANK